MKSLRRSLNNNNATNGSTSPSLTNYSNPLTRPSEKVAPPQKVIKALQSHRSTNPQELSYYKGDFWYVTSEREGWYEALSECPYLSMSFRSDDSTRHHRPFDRLQGFSTQERV